MLRKQSNQCQRGTEAAKDGKYWQGSKGARGTSLHTDPVKLMSEFFIFAFVFAFFFKLATIPAEVSVDNIDFTRLVDKESLFWCCHNSLCSSSFEWF